MRVGRPVLLTGTICVLGLFLCLLVLVPREGGEETAYARRAGTALQPIQSLLGYGAVAALVIFPLLAGGALQGRKRFLLNAAFNNVNPICITDRSFNIIQANEAYWAIFGEPKGGRGRPVKCYEHRPGEGCRSERCPLMRILGGADAYTCEPSKEMDGKMHHFIVAAKPLRDSQGELIGIVESFQDITDRKRLEREKESLILELKESLDKVKLLSGFIPICASCKKIRDDQGYWNQIESYISTHSEAKFSHGICPECIKTLYPDFADPE